MDMFVYTHILCAKEELTKEEASDFLECARRIFGKRERKFLYERVKKIGNNTLPSEWAAGYFLCYFLKVGIRLSYYSTLKRQKTNKCSGFYKKCGTNRLQN